MHIVAGTANSLSTSAFAAMAHYRYRVFVEKLHWELENDGVTELDQFDRSDTMYVMARERDARLKGVARLLPTNQPYLLNDVFPQLLDGHPPEQRKGMGAVKIFSHRSRRSPPRKPSLKRRPRTRPGTAGRRDAHGSFRRRGRTRHRFAPRRRAHSSSSRCRRTSHGQASLSEPALPVRMQDRNRAIDPQAGRPLTFSMKPHERPWRVSRYLAARRQQGCRKALGTAAQSQISSRRRARHATAAALFATRSFRIAFFTW